MSSVGLKAWFEEDDPAQQTCDYMESHEPSQPMNPDCSYRQTLLADSQLQLQQDQQPGVHPDNACWQADEPSWCDYMHEPDLMDDQPALNALHQPHMMHNQQYEELEHAVHAQPYLSSQQQQQQRQQQDAQHELHMQMPQSEQEWQQQHGQQDEPLMGYGPGQDNLTLCDHPVTSQAPSWASHTDNPEDHCIAQEHMQPSGQSYAFYPRLHQLAVIALCAIYLPSCKLTGN